VVALILVLVLGSLIAAGLPLLTTLVKAGSLSARERKELAQLLTQVTTKTANTR